MAHISSVHTFKENLLIVDNARRLWIMGNGDASKIGFGKGSKPMNKPNDTGVILNEKEEVREFQIIESAMIIYTTLGRLFVSKPANQIGRPDDESVNNDSGSEAGTDYSSSDEYSGTDISDQSDNDLSSHYSDSDDGETIIMEHDDEPVHAARTAVPATVPAAIAAPAAAEEQPKADAGPKILNNNDYSEYLDVIGDMETENKGLGLLASDVDEILVMMDYLFFRIKNDIYFYNTHLNPYYAMAGMFGQSLKIIEQNSYYYYQFVFPFQRLKTEFADNFIYFTSQEHYHHLIFFPCIPIECGSSIFFKLNSNLDKNNIKVIGSEVFIIQSDEIYKYHYQTKDIKLFTKKEGIVFTPIGDHRGKTRSILRVQNDGIYTEDGGDGFSKWHDFKEPTPPPPPPKKKSKSKDSDTDTKTAKKAGTKSGTATKAGTKAATATKAADKKPAPPKIEKITPKIDYQGVRSGLIDVTCSYVIYHSDRSERFYVSDNVLYFNVKDVSHYKLIINGGLLYYDNTNTIYYLTDNKVKSGSILFPGVVKIQNIVWKNRMYYLYMFENTPQPISNIWFDDKFIIILSNGKYYYQTIQNKEFTVKSFTEISTQVPKKEGVSVRKKLIMWLPRKMNNSVNLRIDVGSSRLDKLLSLVQMLDFRYNFSIEYTMGTKLISYGNGPKRDFLTGALTEFASKYLIKHNVCTELNLDSFKSMDDAQIKYHGMLLHLIICHNSNYLAVRLPLALISAIAQKEPTIEELEYFGKLADPETFKRMYEFREKPEAITEFGYQSYKHCLQVLCKFYHHDDDDSLNKRTSHVCRILADGFKYYSPVANLTKMNMPTLDYYLSGDYRIDREVLIENLSIKFLAKIKNDDYRKKILDIIRKMPEEKLAIMLKNWSGTSVVMRNTKYHIYIAKYAKHKNTSVYFSACSMELYICEKILNNNDTKECLVDLLASPMNIMIDT